MDRASASIIETQPEIAIGVNGQHLVAKELVVLINLPKRGSNKPSNVVISGTTENSLLLRPQVKLAAGRYAKTGIFGNHGRTEYCQAVQRGRLRRNTPFRHA